MNNKKDIKYLNRDFSDIKKSLDDYAKIYFPSTYKDFSDAQPGSLFLEACAYVGDILSFYQDRQLQESILAYAKDRDSIISLAYGLGYRPKVSATSIVDLDVYQLLPSKISASIATPDYNYTLILDKESVVGSDSNSDVQFITQDLVDFSFSSSMDPTEISVYQINTGTNLPDYYLLKKKIKAISGKIKSQNFTYGSPTRFPTINISDDNIIYVIDIIDSDGNKWYEVPFMAQNTVPDEIRNTSVNEPNMFLYRNSVPYVLRFKKVQRRYVTRFLNDTSIEIEFGAGTNSQADEEIIPNSDNVGMGLIDSISKLNYAYDPSNFLYTKDYGISPSNTVLTVRYLVGGGLVSNVPSNDIKRPVTLNIKSTALSDSLLNQNVLDFIKRSIAFNNTLPASGGGEGDTVDDVRFNSLSSFAAQSRNVTEDDYVIRCLSMPPKFGSIAKAFAIQDYEMMNNINDSLNYNPFAISLYILSFDQNKKLTNASLALKSNLRNYISQYRMTTDAVTIKNGYIINIGVNFSITVLPAFNSREVLSDCLIAVEDYFNIDKWSINQPIVLSEIYNLISLIKGVQSVSNVEIINLYGESSGYSPYGYDIKAATKNNVIFPSLDPSCFEVKYPTQDISGRVVNI